MYVGKHRKPAAHPIRNRVVVSTSIIALTLGGAVLASPVASAEPIVTIASVTPLLADPPNAHHDNDNRGDDNRDRGDRNRGDRDRGSIVRGDDHHRRGPVFQHHNWWQNRCRVVRSWDFKHHRMVFHRSCGRLWYR